MEQPQLEEKILKELYNTFVIPPYQRPYKWHKSHVIQLLDDLYENIYIGKRTYRVGTLIVHQDKEGIHNIVDGQQRLTTLSLILYYLGKKDKLLQNQEYTNEISKNNLIYNYNQIKQWFRAKKLEKDKEKFLNELENKCEFVVITVYRQDEAFQLFDTQNSRGKELSPHDLLKAFHLREMDKDGYTDKEIEQYVIKWEDYLLDKDNPLPDILNNHLYRIRKWIKGEDKYSFTKTDLNEFKGISLYKGVEYNYELSLRILEGIIENTQKEILFRNFGIAQSYPFQIGMSIINGRNFFDYVFYYIELNKQLFERNDKFIAFYKKRCLNYRGAERVGDIKVRNLFENICLLFVDRFGLSFLEEAYYDGFYKNVYLLRLEKKAISENSILKHDQALRFFRSIPNSYSPEELKIDLFCNYIPHERGYAKGVEEGVLIYFNL
ncbi:DUF262 domain-containing protein [uncultured Capnocytophaga sp.]|uniref:DUF262 domain-containing protein n=1 Tax=uncultured Capnocytophaga sp. TaxID=159273 RepID=UPI00262DBE19|nr:DUF262 domain-containing protein [uncultured Capnocytophaga sp.]